MRISSDFIVIGSGIAGLSFALKAAEHGTVSILVKTTKNEGATPWAQGGIAAVFSKDDSFDSHIQDTLVAGDGLCREDAVRVTVTEGPKRVDELIRLGVPFSKTDDTNKSSANIHGATDDFPFDLTQEGGHHARRILHADDFTGRAISETLLRVASNHPNIRFFEHHVAIDLITNTWLKKRRLKGVNVAQQGGTHPRRRCLGVYALDASKPHEKGHDQIHTFVAPITVLASGGAGKVYLYTSNPDVATGDGIAMAYRAGARVANMEFTQFHPTCLFHPRSKSFLISEALRGEGGELINDAGEAFMRGQHEMGSLAPRDIVARAIDAEIKRRGVECVYLDMSAAVKAHGADGVRKRFPNIYEKCLQFGIDITKDPIPVVPAAHYTCGGVATDLNGETSIENLFAIGEVASTGLHGANRLASNSLLEGVVFAHRAFEACLGRMKAGTLRSSRNATPDPLPEWDSGRAVPIEERIDISHTWKEIRTLMWDYVGIVRTNRRLARARERLDLIRHEVNEYYWNYLLDRDLIELRNLLQVARLMVRSAQLRKESRGLHYNLDYPYHDDRHYLKDTVL
jgi:L-aspartate oxidase